MTPTHYLINVEIFLKTSILGDEITLPYSKELSDAVELIGKFCSKEVERRQRHLDDEFLMKQFSKLKKTTSGSESKKILEQILEYGRKK